MPALVQHIIRKLVWVANVVGELLRLNCLDEFPHVVFAVFVGSLKGREVYDCLVTEWRRDRRGIAIREKACVGVSRRVWWACVAATTGAARISATVVSGTAVGLVKIAIPSSLKNRNFLC